MSEVKHTPGPWVATEDVGTHVIRGANVSHATAVGTYEFRDYVASTWGGPHEANARLISAAPELLDAVRLVSDWRDACDANGATASFGNPLPTGMLEVLRAARDKATGARHD
jgi:hypothetical protein